MILFTKVQIPEVNVYACIYVSRHGKFKFTVLNHEEKEIADSLYDYHSANEAIDSAIRSISNEVNLVIQKAMVDENHYF